MFPTKRTIGWACGAALAALAWAPILTAQDATPAVPPMQAEAPEAELDFGPIPEVAARVNDEPITGDLYRRALALETRQLRANPTAQQRGITELTTKQRQLILDTLINGAVSFELAKQRGVEVTDGELDQLWEQERARFESEEKYLEFVEKTDFKIEQWREDTRKKLMMMRVHDQMAEGIAATDEEVQQIYGMLKDRGMLNAPKNYDFHHILVKADKSDPAADDAAKAKLVAARERLVKGEDFAAVAREVSEDALTKERGGEYLGVKQGVLPEDFEAPALAVPIGQLSEPISSRAGWHLVRMDAVNEAGPVSYERAKEDLRKRIVLRKQREVIDKAITEARAGMKVEIFVEFPEAEKAPAAAEIDSSLLDASS